MASQRSEIPRTVAVTVLVLAASLVGAAATSTAGHVDTEVVHEESVDRSGAFGVAVDMAEAGALSVSLEGEEDGSSTPLSGGLVFFDEAGDYHWMIAITVHRSPDRLVISPSPEQPEPASAAGGEAIWQTRTRGDDAVLETADVSLEVDRATDGTATSGVSVTIGATLLNASAGTNRVGLWLGEIASTTLTVASDANVSDVRTRAGTAHVAGDLDLEANTVQAQVQRTPVDPSLFLEDARAPLGVKVLADASTTVEAERSLFGFWGHVDWKEGCAGLPTTVACANTEYAFDVCRSLAGVDCSKAALSWRGPHDQGRLRNVYAFQGTASGSYAFTVDQKVDLYGPDYRHASGTGAKLTEHFSYLTVGDLTVPS